MTMFRPLRLILLSLLVRGVVSSEQPILIDGSCRNEDDCTCSIWTADGWIIAGKDYTKDEQVGWQDVVVPFTQHDRRAFPLWGRFAYFRQVPNKPYEFIFAPAIHYPFECHSYMHNLELASPIDQESKISPPLLTDRLLRMGDPLFLPCLEVEHTATSTIFDVPRYSLDDLKEFGTCLDGLQIAPSTVAEVSLGAFTTKKFAKGTTLMSSIALHMHRSELYNVTGDYHEELLNYCFGVPESDLLMLPLAPAVNSINHNSEPNVAIEWDTDDEDIRSVFSSPTRIAFAVSEDPQVSIKYVALRDIEPGEELFIDYGTEWQKAWDSRDKSKTFRREIGFNLFPEYWLKNEARDSTFPEWDTVKLAPGEVKHATLTTGEAVGTYIHRVGLPNGLSEKIAVWAEEIGMTKVMKKYLVPGQELPVNGEEHVLINGGRWWLKRFDNSWRSNLFYVSPDDDEANEQYMHALSAAGWDQVLEGIGKHFELKTLSNFYPSFIAMTHCQYSYMHSDSDYSNVFNVIFPLEQVNNTNSAGVAEAEINLGRNQFQNPDNFNVPYKYEPDHAVVLGLDGMHGTAPGDYRGTGKMKMRMVASVYAGDFSDDEMLESYVENWNDPPYPRKNKLRESLKKRIHWHAGDPTLKSGSPQVKV